MTNRLNCIYIKRGKKYMIHPSFEMRFSFAGSQNRVQVICMCEGVLCAAKEIGYKLAYGLPTLNGIYSVMPKASKSRRRRGKKFARLLFYFIVLSPVLWYSFGFFRFRVLFYGFGHRFQFACLSTCEKKTFLIEGRNSTISAAVSFRR